jgi:xanthine/uracil permease
MVKDGYKSRKFWMTVLAVGVLFVAAILSDKYPSILGVYPTFAGTVLGCLTVYLGGNIGHHIVNKKSNEPEPVAEPKLDQ